MGKRQGHQSVAPLSLGSEHDRQKLIKSTKGLAVEALLVTGTLLALCGIVVVVIVSLGATRPRTTPGTKRRPQQRHRVAPGCLAPAIRRPMLMFTRGDRKSTRLNSSHTDIS